MPNELNEFVQYIKGRAVLEITSRHNGKTLDVGCGDKRYTRLLSNPIGIDINQHYEQMNNSHDICMSAENLGFKDSSFDEICFFDTLEHIKDVDSAIKQAWKLLKENGILAIIDPNDKALIISRLAVLRIKEAIAGNKDHIHRFKKSDILKLTKNLFKLEIMRNHIIFTAYRFRKVN